MLFSILIANYNNSRYLENSLNSVLSQSYPNWEIIIVDDCSTDDFDSVIEKFEKHPKIKIYKNKKNQGCGYTKKKCAGLATGDILGFLDPDDSLDPEAIKVMINAHIEKPSCSIVHSTHYICDEFLNVKRIAEYPRPLPQGVPYLFLNDGRVHSFASFKYSCYKKTEGISVLYKKAVDQDLYYKLEEEGEIFFINTPLYYYRIHNGGISTTGKEAEAMLWHYQVIEEACLRRIKKITLSQGADPQNLLKLYKTKYYKTQIFSNFKKKRWLGFTYNLLLYPFVGGASNLLSYARKFPKEGLHLIRKSFLETHKIKLIESVKSESNSCS